LGSLVGTTRLILYTVVYRPFKEYSTMLSCRTGPPVIRDEDKKQKVYVYSYSYRILIRN